MLPEQLKSERLKDWKVLDVRVGWWVKLILSGDILKVIYNFGDNLLGTRPSRKHGVKIALHTLLAFFMCHHAQWERGCPLSPLWRKRPTAPTPCVYLAIAWHWATDRLRSRECVRKKHCACGLAAEDSTLPRTLLHFFSQGSKLSSPTVSRRDYLCIFFHL